MGDSLPFLLPERVSGKCTARLARAGSAFKAGSFVRLNAVPSISSWGCVGLMFRALHQLQKAAVLDLEWVICYLCSAQLGAEG